ncbi:NifU N-terminal domain-containing protein [Kordiimonas lacus]|uniref:Scaffold protein Nfu/NifU N terminal n=1 Tax=Kordiimonas lacus TaxID=637679 RepID=A0A1G7EC14_9PROT|nr:NifU N-terminal domain-containing protein [Kordiimonas lacus]SDE60925.1 Scaffold protein Nfu/NifU N terminal [Kordiimonas lacus]
MIEIETTADPNRRNFLPHRMLHSGDVVKFPTKQSAVGSPLPEGLFAVNGVTAVHIGRDYVGVYKDGAADWGDIQGPIKVFLEEVFPEERNEEGGNFMEGLLAADILASIGVIFFS